MTFKKKKSDAILESRPNPEVDVLIAIHNGSEFLREQLMSVAMQRGVEINLIVGFDGLDTKSDIILDEFRSRFRSIQKYTFPNIGVDENFSTLLTKSQSLYIATCDQDDVWLEDHLTKSIHLLISDKPSLTFTQLEEFNNKNKSVKKWPILKQNRIPSFSIFENIARGCTQVINSQAREILLSVERPKDIPRDWWFYAIIHALDGVRFLPEVTVRYRLHEANLIGADRRISKRLSRLSRNRLSKTFTLARELQVQLSNVPPTIPLNRLDTLIQGLTGGFYSRIKVSLILTEKYRSDFLTEIILRIILLFSTFKYSKNNQSI